MLFGRRRHRHRSSAPSPVARRVAVSAEPLEGRRLMSTVIALQPKNVLLAVDSANPSVVLQQTRVRGLAPRESLVGIDFRPATGELFGVGSSSVVYRIDLASGQAAAAGPALAVGLQGNTFGVDFNPAADHLRVVSDSDQNLRLNPGDGSVVDADPADAGVQADTNLAFAATDGGAGVDPTIVAAAHSNNVAGGTPTTFYGIDANRNVLVTQGSPGGAPTSPDTGQLYTVGALGVDPLAFGGFDIQSVNGADAAFAAFQTSAKQPATLYTVNLATGAATAGGEIGRKRQPTLAIAVAPAGVNFVAVTARNELLALNTAVPSLVLGRTRIGGIARRDRVVGIDFRPANNALYALTSGDQLYTINLATAAATPIGPASAVDLDGRGAFGFDVNPSADRIRVVNDADQNLRIDPNTGTIVDFDPNTSGVQPDTGLAYIAGDANRGANPSLVGAAYTNNVSGGTPTTLYGIDANRNVLVTVGSPTGNPTSPNTGQLLTVGPLGVNVGEIAGFDIRTSGGTDTAYATFVTDSRRDGLYRINLTSGAATYVSAFNPKVKGLQDIALLPS